MAKKFELEAEAQRLFNEARARGDATGAASVLRLIRDLQEKDAPRTSGNNDDSIIVNAMTADEREATSEHLRQVFIIRAAVRQRLNMRQPPAWQEPTESRKPSTVYERPAQAVRQPSAPEPAAADPATEIVSVPAPEVYRLPRSH